ncbi:TolC family protein [Pelomicrobium sp.]|jgi:hypothetical protein
MSQIPRVALALAAVALAAALGFPPAEAAQERAGGPRLPNLQGGSYARGVEPAVEALLAGPLTLHDAIRIALVTNAELLREYRELGITPSALVQSGLLASRAAPLQVRSDFLGLPLATATQPLRAPDELRAQVARTALAVSREVAGAYLDLALAEALAPHAEQLAEAALAAAELGDGQRKAGNASLLKTLPHRVQLAEVTLERDLARVALANAQRELARRLSLVPGGRPLKTAGLPALPDTLPQWQGLQAFAWANRLDARRAEERFRADNPTGYASALPETRVRLPLLAPDNLYRLQAPVPKAELELLETHRRVAAEVANAEARLRLAYARADGYRATVLPVKTALVDETLKHYNGMLVGVYDLIEAKREELEARKQYLEAVRDFWIATLDLEQAVGGELPQPVAFNYAEPAAPQETLKTGAAHAGQH